uniref:tRNA (guanine(9)-N(1))-methyltransferase n=1 Tax=Corethron hystrix TaxID=216773 RepID=A0A7S1BU27_9STRA|mmetsp:Transcript_3921/g.7474  ORF Transcript_3921/g.7474 Transcript_3921/m.7474 type:complete len:282 (+) Transcript_3921:268-1113(+)
MTQLDRSESEGPPVSTSEEPTATTSIAVTNAINTTSDKNSVDNDSPSLSSPPESSASPTSPSPLQTQNPEDANAESGADAPKLSKSAAKKLARKRKIQEKHRMRKLRAKENKRAAALASGRDLDRERKDQAEREAAGTGRKRRQAAELARFEGLTGRSGGICVDCAYAAQPTSDAAMTQREMNSLSQQIMYCYSLNRRSRDPVRFSVTSLRPGTVVYDNLNKLQGFPDNWIPRGFTFGDGKELDDLTTLHDKDRLVYLTSDSENVLKEIDDDKVYVIGTFG